MHTRIAGRGQMWIRSTPPPQPIPPNSSIVNYLPGDETKPSLVILALAEFNYGAFKATLHKLRREVRLIIATNEAELGHFVQEESGNGTLAGVIIADGEIMRRARRRLATALVALLHDPEHECTVIFAFDFARHAWRDSSRFTRFMRRHFPTLRWKVGDMMAVKEKMVLRRRVLRKMGARVYRKKYSMRGVVFTSVKQADKVIVMEKDNGWFEYLVPDLMMPWVTREDPDTPSTCRASGDEVFDCQMGVVDDFEEDEVHGVVDGNVYGHTKPRPYIPYGCTEDYSFPSNSDCPSLPCTSSNSSSSSERMSVSIACSNDTDDDVDDLDGDNSVGENGDEDEDEDVDMEDTINIEDEPVCENCVDTDIEDKDDNNNQDSWVPSDDERSIDGSIRACTVALHEFKNRRYSEETGRDETLCSYFGIIGHAEDNRSLASIILGMCSVTPSW